MVHAFRRNRALTAAVVVTLSVGVGVSAAMFNLVDVLLFRPPPHVADPDRLVEVPSGSNFVRYRRLQRQAQSLELAVHTRMPVMIGLGGGPDDPVVRAECVSDNYFQMLGVRPIVGRGFSEEITSTDGGRPVVLSHGLWKRLFGGATTVIGATLVLERTGHTVVGIAPANFTGVRLEPVDVWLPLTHSPELCSFTGQNLLSSSSVAGWLSTIGRVRDPFTIEQAAAEVAANDKQPFATLAAPGTAVRPLASSRRARVAQDGRMALWLAGGSLLVLLIACANVAILLALRAFERRLEIAIRVQLGATRRRVFLLLFVENLALALICIGTAVLVGIWVDTGLRAFFPTLPDAHINARSVKIVAGFAVFAGVMGGVVPAAQIARSNASLLLRSGHQVIGGARTRNALLVLQVAFAQLLLVGSGLFVRSVHNLLTGAGYDIQPIIVATVELERQGYSIPDAWSKIDTFIERVRSIPAVVSVGVSSDTLLNSGGMTVAVAIRSSLGSRNSPTLAETHSMNAVTPDYFTTLGTRIRRGRAFTAADNASARPVVIVDQGLAAAEWPGQDPLGRCAYIGSRQDCAEIVGIIETRRSTFLSRVRREFFVPAPQAAAYNLHTVPRTLFMRTEGAPVQDVVPSIVAVLQSVIPELPKANVRPLLDLADVDTKSWRLGARLFSLYAIAAVVMTGVGLFAALTLMVRQRTTELAVRIALGATPGAVMRLMVRHVGTLLASGWVLGTLLIMLTGRFIERLLFEVKPTEPGVLVWVTLLLCGVAALGTLLPTMRAARLNPTEALRQ